MPKHLALPSSPQLEASEGLDISWEPSQVDTAWAPALQARDPPCVPRPPISCPQMLVQGLGLRGLTHGRMNL